jgi:hypothetical protein
MIRWDLRAEVTDSGYKNGLFSEISGSILAKITNLNEIFVGNDKGFGTHYHIAAGRHRYWHDANRDHRDYRHIQELVRRHCDSDHIREYRFNLSDTFRRNKGHNRKLTLRGVDGTHYNIKSILNP